MGNSFFQCCNADCLNENELNLTYKPSEPSSKEPNTQVAIPQGNADYLKSLFMSPDGRFIVPWSGDRSKLYSVKIKLKEATRHGDSLYVKSSSMSAESRDQSASSWNVKTKSQEAILQRNTGCVKSVCKNYYSSSIVPRDTSVRSWRLYED